MAGGQRGDEFNSQEYAVKDLLARAPDPQDEADANAALEEERTRARGRGDLMAFELRLLGNTMKRIERCQGQIRSDALQTHQAQVDMLKVMREIRDNTGSTAQESPQHQSVAVSLLAEIKDLLHAISAVAMMKTNGSAH
jgi:hypothetical protein